MSEIYRDRTEGAAAKRQELLRRRRDELVTMPHTIRRVVVARSARIAASLAVVVAGTALLATASSPTVTAWLARGLPGIQPAVLSTLLSATWIVGICVYALARARVEHRFAVAMSRYVLPGADLDHDIERLDHEHPDEAAKQMAHRLEVRSAAFPVIAAALVLPATAVYLVHAVKAHGWPVMSEFETSLAAHAGALVAIALAGVVAGIVLTRRTARLPIVGPIAGSLALALGGLAIVTATKTSGSTTWGLGAVAMLGGTLGIVARRLRIERELIAAEDPAAGSELFTLRGFVRQLRASLTSVRGVLAVANLKRLARRPIALTAILGAGFAALVAYTAHSRSTRAHAVDEHRDLTFVPNMPGSFGLEPGFRVERAADGRLRFDVTLDGDTPLEIPSLSDLGMLPANWRAHVAVQLSDHTDAEPVVVTFTGDPKLAPTVLGSEPSTFDTEVCDGRAKPLGLRVEAGHPHHGQLRVTLFVKPELGVARCN